jgi:hypothetical protein
MLLLLLFMAPDCLELAFKDQRGRTEVYPAEVGVFDDTKIAVTYAHLGGRLELTIDERAKDHVSAHGMWHQDNGGGHAALRFENNHRRAVGWWTFGDADRHYDLTLRPCKTQ